MLNQRKICTCIRLQYNTMQYIIQFALVGVQEKKQLIVSEVSFMTSFFYGKLKKKITSGAFEKYRKNESLILEESVNPLYVSLQQKHPVNCLKFLSALNEVFKTLRLAGDGDYSLVIGSSLRLLH